MCQWIAYGVGALFLLFGILLAVLKFISAEDIGSDGILAVIGKFLCLGLAESKEDYTFWGFLALYFVAGGGAIAFGFIKCRGD